MNTDKERQALLEWIDKRRNSRLRFGQFDCCTLCADYLQSFHGMDDMMGDFRGAYKNHAEAMQIIEDNGGLQKLMEAQLGPMHPPERCEAGAIVLGDFGDGPTLGICTGHNAIGVSLRGLVGMPISRCEGCWPL